MLRSQRMLQTHFWRLKRIESTMRDFRRSHFGGLAQAAVRWSCPSSAHSVGACHPVKAQITDTSLSMRLASTPSLRIAWVA